MAKTAAAEAASSKEKGESLEIQREKETRAGQWLTAGRKRKQGMKTLREELSAQIEKVAEDVAQQRAELGQQRAELEQQRAEWEQQRAELERRQGEGLTEVD